MIYVTISHCVENVKSVFRIIVILLFLFYFLYGCFISLCVFMNLCLLIENFFVEMILHFAVYNSFHITQQY
jgi:hypothetical protein